MKFVWPGALRRLFQRRFSRTTTVIVVGVLVLIGAAVGGARWWNDTHPTGIEGAIAALPASATTMQFTDWSQVRIQLRVLQGQEVKSMGNWLDTSTYDPNSPSAVALSTLSATSIINNPDDAANMQKQFGVSPANLQWEAYGSLPNGGVEVLSTNATVDLAAVRAKLAKAGYVQAESGMWSLADGSALLPDFTNIALFPDQHLMLASASSAALTATMQSVEGKTAHLNSVTSLGNLVGNLGQPIAADVWVRDSVCGDTKISYSAQGYPDPSVQQQISTAINQAGGLTPLNGFALTLNTDSTVTAAAQFDSNAAAQRDLKPRTALASGPTYVSSDNYAQEFSILSADTKNATILLNLQPVEGDAILSQLVQGAIIFASC